MGRGCLHSYVSSFILRQYYWRCDPFLSPKRKAWRQTKKSANSVFLLTWRMCPASLIGASCDTVHLIHWHLYIFFVISIYLSISIYHFISTCTSTSPSPAIASHLHLPSQLHPSHHVHLPLSISPSSSISILSSSSFPSSYSSPSPFKSYAKTTSRWRPE